jgi:hypothetical protein
VSTRLREKVAIVIGAPQGIGAGVAEEPTLLSFPPTMGLLSGLPAGIRGWPAPVNAGSSVGRVSLARVALRSRA